MSSETDMADKEDRWKMKLQEHQASTLAACNAPMPKDHGTTLPMDMLISIRTITTSSDTVTDHATEIQGLPATPRIFRDVMMVNLMYTTLLEIELHAKKRFACHRTQLTKTDGEAPTSHKRGTAMKVKGLRVDEKGIGDLAISIVWEDRKKVPLTLANWERIHERFLAMGQREGYESTRIEVEEAAITEALLDMEKDKNEHQAKMQDQASNVPTLNDHGTIVPMCVIFKIRGSFVRDSATKENDGAATTESKSAAPRIIDDIMPVKLLHASLEDVEAFARKRFACHCAKLSTQYGETTTSHTAEGGTADLTMHISTVNGVRAALTKASWELTRDHLVDMSRTDGLEVVWIEAEGGADV
ncbi:hypothetical protein LTR53_004125 [Teratosphaeriaceae sp. CCFEE 6253]|nr:hypothetical protein LTR53_004125 [Teratosphaeriaceae sp. CCFEE 6253]